MGEGKERKREGIIIVHALCIVSHSEKDGAASGKESEVNTANANELCLLEGTSD